MKLPVRDHKHIFDRVALLLSLVTVFAAYLVADRVYERIPHFEDEMAYVWQAKAIAGGDLVLPSPPNPKSFLVPFVVDYNGIRFGKYPPGWPATLALGYLSGVEDWVNPLLAGLGIWLLYLLARRITTPATGLLAVFLMLTSPMFWLLSGSLLSHAWSLVLSLGFVLAWLDTFLPREHKEFVTHVPPKWLTALIAGLSLGALALSRPMSAFGLALPFFVHGVMLLVRGDRVTRLRVLTVGLLGAAVGGMVIVWQFAVTGDLLLNPYTLWWEYDKIGFGLGFGLWEDGHNLKHAWENLVYSLWAPRGTGGDILGWGSFWGMFLPFGLWALRKNRAAWLVAGIFPALLLVYIPYWTGSWEYGPRYYYEGMSSIMLLTAVGFAWLVRDGTRTRRHLAVFALVVLVGHNLFAYLPSRLWEMHGMYNINRAMLEPFYTMEARALTPALVIVYPQEKWTEYGGLLELQDAHLTTPFIFALHRTDAVLAGYQAAFPERGIYHYYPDEPSTFYLEPR